MRRLPIITDCQGTFELLVPQNALERALWSSALQLTDFRTESSQGTQPEFECHWSSPLERPSEPGWERRVIEIMIEAPGMPLRLDSPCVGVAVGVVWDVEREQLHTCWRLTNPRSFGGLFDQSEEMQRTWDVRVAWDFLGTNPIIGLSYPHIEVVRK